MCREEVVVHTLIQQNHEQKENTNNSNNVIVRKVISFYSLNHVKHEYYVRGKCRSKMAHVGYIVLNYV
jgi:hypothetical protein